ncbi:MAG: glutamine-hydrolyzing carbamoyl-phosphate synthase small subunit [Candidatus Omnitrophica bacterium]|nr:glutamine-hydrolyzing carbamoyl-phosphate synthase small subunit [Candidatus Omnitrophota bacterium]
MKAKIVLEDGRIFKGSSFGAAGESSGEVVFNTSLSGYQEILTDPSYKGQIVTMTYPLIGNYGINSEDMESRRPFVEGFVVKEASRIASNWRSEKTLDVYLKENAIIGIEGIDTRALTKHIRLKGSMRAIISTIDLDDNNLIKKVKSIAGILGRDLAKEVMVEKPFHWNKRGKYKVLVIDCGVKFNILRKLSEHNCRVKVMPGDTSFKDIINERPDGILISNGPGDPEGALYVAETIKKLIGKVPVFGICFGHQLIGLALGGKISKLKFGHHGGNHPVKDLRNGKIFITAQNHNFCVDIDSLGKEEIEITHINLNDKTLEGMRHKKFPLFSVQFHPEHSPGPHDAGCLFKEFVNMIEVFNAKKN